MAQAERLTVEDLALRTGIGTHCGLCVAYLRRALDTGQMEFDELLPLEPLQRRSTRDERNLHRPDQPSESAPQD